MYNHNKASKAKTVCIFLGIYCSNIQRIAKLNITIAIYNVCNLRHVSFDIGWKFFMHILIPMLGNKPSIVGPGQSCGILIANASEIPKSLLSTLSRNNTINHSIQCKAINLFLFKTFEIRLAVIILRRHRFTERNMLEVLINVLH